MTLAFDQGVTLVGGGALTRETFQAARALAPVVVAADSGADWLEGWGEDAAAVIGDMDSVTRLAGWRGRPGVSVLHLPEQDTTDFEKCLYSVEAPFFLGVGFSGRRLDHTLAALHALLRWPSKRVALIGEEDVAFLCPQDWRATLAPGARVSFFPLREVEGIASAGLRWPVEGLAFAPGDRIGTSNAADAAQVSARFDRPGMVALLERRWLGAALESLRTP